MYIYTYSYTCVCACFIHAPNAYTRTHTLTYTDACINIRISNIDMSHIQYIPHLYTSAPVLDKFANVLYNLYIYISIYLYIYISIYLYNPHTLDRKGPSLTSSPMHLPVLNSKIPRQFGQPNFSCTYIYVCICIRIYLYVCVYVQVRERESMCVEILV